MKRVHLLPLTATLVVLANIAAAIEETITTPTPGLGHGRLGDVAALATFILGSLHVL